MPQRMPERMSDWMLEDTSVWMRVYIPWSWLSSIPWDRHMFRMSVSAKDRMANVWRQYHLRSPIIDNSSCSIKVDNNHDLTTPTRHVMVGIPRSEVSATKKWKFWMVFLACFLGTPCRILCLYGEPQVFFALSNFKTIQWKNCWIFVEFEKLSNVWTGWMSHPP